MARDPQLAAIHVGRKALGWEEETYRALLQALTGKRSAGEMSAAERAKVIDYMRSQGFAPLDGGDPAAAVARRLQVPEGTKPQVALIEALWEALAERGALRREDAAAGAGLDAWVARTTGVASRLWLTPAQANQAIEGLKAWLRRSAGWKPPGGKAGRKAGGRGRRR